MASVGGYVSMPLRIPTPSLVPVSMPSNSRKNRVSLPFCISNSASNGDPEGEIKQSSKKQKSQSQSSWSAKNSEGKDYLYRLGQEADNMNISVGARKGIIDDLFVGKFLGKDADIVFAYRQKVTRSFEHLQGDYYIAPAFLDKIVVHIVKNYIAHLVDAKVPLILGIWGGKGQGKSFQTELIFRAMGIEPVILSAGELESERAGEPGKLIRERYRTASLVIKNQGKMSCLMINDIDAGVGRFGNTQMTVNNQIVIGTLMNLADNPTRVSVGQDWSESDISNRVPIIVTGNDLSTLYAPLIRDGRMDKFYWKPTREDLINIVHQMYQRDGISREEIVQIVDAFPNQALDFYGALRSRTYDRFVLKWVEEIGGAEKLGEKLLRRRKDDPLPTFIPPEEFDNFPDRHNRRDAGWFLNKKKQMGDLKLPDFFNYPPYFTLQPVRDTREKQVQLWKELILNYCKHHKIYIVSLEEEFPLFFNPAIDRKLSYEAKKVFLSALVSEGRAEWLDKGQKKCLILWRRIQDWAEYILKFVHENGLEDGVMTLEEIRSGVESRGTELAGIDRIVLIRSLKLLEQRGKAVMFKGTSTDDEGVKFSA